MAQLAWYDLELHEARQPRNHVATECAQTFGVKSDRAIRSTIYYVAESFLTKGVETETPLENAQKTEGSVQIMSKGGVQGTTARAST